MKKTDYDRALYYTHQSEWNNLLILMIRTEDHFLSKKIEHFLHAYEFEHDYTTIQQHLFTLFRYLEHASSMVMEREGFQKLYS